MTHEVVGTTTHYEGSIVDVRVDSVVQADGATAEREVVQHDDSVAVLALDEYRRVLFIQHYRHPIGQSLWELPAGLRDKPGEDPLETAQRELAEETGIQAGRWSSLVDLRTSPGILTETCRVYLAQDLAPDHRSRGAQATDEEAEIVTRWLPLADAVEEVWTGHLTDAMTVAGILAAMRAVALGVPPRPADAPWPSAAES